MSASPARATRRATRERSRAAAGQLAESLPPDTLRVICLSLRSCSTDDAVRSLLRMQQTCKSWRAALLISEDEIWKELALVRFPSLRRILRLEPTTAPYRRLYRQQLLGERARLYECPPLDPGPVMSAYIFSCELYLDQEPIGGATIIGEDRRLIFKMDMHAGPTSMDEWDRMMEDQAVQAIAKHTLRLRVSVTRRTDLSTIVLFDEYDVSDVFESGDGEDLLLWFTHFTAPLPSKVGGAGLCTHDISAVGHGNLNTLAFAPTFSVSGKDRSCECQCDFVNNTDLESQSTECLVRTYFAHYAPWPDVPA